MKFTAHCPNYVDGFKHAGVDGTLAEVLADPWVKQWSDSPDFHRWALSDNCLIAEQHGGDSQGVVGYLTPPPIGELPEWHESDWARRSREAWNRGDIKTVDAVRREMEQRTKALSQPPSSESDAAKKAQP